MSIVYVFLNFLLIGLCNSSANYWFGMISLTVAPPEVLVPADFLSKHLQTNEAGPC